MITHRQPDGVEAAVNKVLPIIIGDPVVPMLFQPVLGILAISDVELNECHAGKVSVLSNPLSSLIPLIANSHRCARHRGNERRRSSVRKRTMLLREGQTALRYDHKDRVLPPRLTPRCFLYLKTLRSSSSYADIVNGL
jgi:hypothetical protein